MERGGISAGIVQTPSMGTRDHPALGGREGEAAGDSGVEAGQGAGMKGEETDTRWQWASPWKEYWHFVE